MLSQYDFNFVALSYAVAFLASYTALQLASRISAAAPVPKRVWVAGGAVAMGFGIWAMHFIGMLALNLPMALSYEPATTAASGLVAILASALALGIMGAAELTARRLVAGGLVLGAAICGMHYTGMAAIPIAPGIRYDWWLVALSGVVAVVASTVALWLVFFLTQRSRAAKRGVGYVNVVAAAILGLAICGMHYTGMAAAHFVDGSICGTGTTLDKYALAYGVSLAAAVLLAAALSLSILDAHLTKQRELSLALLKENRALNHKAQHDHLTGLPNRAQMEEHLAAELAATREADQELAVLFMDLDGFKLVNDTAGHATGDVVLTTIAGRLAGVMGSSGFVSRVSGDEFVMVQQGLDIRALEQLCVRLLEAVRQPVEASGSAYTVSGSLGVALRLTPYDDVRTLLTRADQAMYAAKKSGKNGFRFADGAETTTLAKEFERALRNKEFSLLFQPTVDAATLAVTGAEALVRWNHPERGMVPPNEFIPQAEELGFIEPLGDWVLQEALGRLAQWQADGYEQSLAVNLSPVQLQNDQFALRVRQLLAQYKVDPKGLVLEVTETFAMVDVERCRRVLAELQELGVLIAVDDFGTGYSSLSHLYKLPVGELKIDKSFVQALGTDEGAHQICSAMVALAHSLKLTVVAEGVETMAQQVTLSKLGCDTFQGYRFGKPMPWQDLQALVANAPEMLKAA